MKWTTYYHGYPLILGNRNTGWRSCCEWKPFGLKWISAILLWFYHNLMCYFNIKYSLKADKVICVSNASKRQFIEQARKYKLIK